MTDDSLPPNPVLEPSSTPQSFPLEDFDRAYRAQLAQLTQGISPASLISAYMDWLVHLSISPGKQIELMHFAQQNLKRLTDQAMQSSNDAYPPCIEPLPQDQRFDTEQ